VTALAGVVVSMATAGSQTSAQHAPKARATVVLGPTPIPAVFPGPLDGLATAKGNALRRPIAVLIDNFEPDARPQSGISTASVVFETVVEDGITRIMPIFLERGATSFGPVRSVRPYFISWAAGYRALLVHDGGSPAALRMLPRVPQVADVDASTYGTQFIRTQDRQPPHNLFASTAAIRAISAANGFNRRVSFAWIVHKAAGPLPSRESARSIHIDFSLPTIASPAAYAVDYRFDSSTNEYVRIVGGAPAVDQVSSRQLSASNVVAIFANIVLIPRDSQHRVEVQTLGRGRAMVFQDGQVVRGSWDKATEAAPIRLRDSRGHTIALNPGATWYEIVPPGGVTFKANQ
jgi:Protein of unknown function (DUF3048) N-terminal domain/Protein of unknown function (DUF3048) C-terminal domain